MEGSRLASLFFFRRPNGLVPDGFQTVSTRVSGCCSCFQTASGFQTASRQFSDSFQTVSRQVPCVLLVVFPGRFQSKRLADVLYCSCSQTVSRQFLCFCSCCQTASSFQTVSKQVSSCCSCFPVGSRLITVSKRFPDRFPCTLHASWQFADSFQTGFLVSFLIPSCFQTDSRRLPDGFHTGVFAFVLFQAVSRLFPGGFQGGFIVYSLRWFPNGSRKPI